MPIYEYHCDACDTLFEEWRRHVDDVTEQPCPKCHENAHRVISNTTFVLKGGGWYVTEYGNRKTDSSSASSSTAVAPAAGSGTKDAAPSAPPEAVPAPQAPAPSTP